MCDYSLEAFKSRAAEVGDYLEVKSFGTTVGLVDPKEPDTAVCLRPGAEVAFDRNIETGMTTYATDVAVFTQVETDNRYRHHDALEMADGKQVLITQLIPGQTCRVLQLPAEAAPAPTAGVETPQPENVSG